ncbi:DUF5724 domain-containing protein [Empedobacter falsenii]|nr:hypothetical protein [Flavobacteriaceae bacterium]
MSKVNWSDEKLISRLINYKTDKSRWETIRILRSRPSKDLFEKCIKLINSNDQNKKIIGIDILAQLGKDKRPFRKETLKIYFELLNSETNVNVLFSILSGISFNEKELNKKQINKICSFQNSNSDLIKQGIVNALGFIEDEKAIDVLIKFSKDKANRIRSWATFYIGHVDFDNEYIREALWSRVNDKHQETRMEAITGLAKRKDDRIIEVIKQEIIKDDFGSLLFEAILETENKDFIPILQQELNDSKNIETINSDWIKGFEECIDDLQKL